MNNGCAKIKAVFCLSAFAFLPFNYIFEDYIASLMLRVILVSYLRNAIAHVQSWYEYLY